MEPVSQVEAISTADDRQDGRELRHLTEAMPRMPKPYGWSWELTWDPEDIPPSDYIIFVYNAVEDDPVASGFGATIADAARGAYDSLQKWLLEHPDYIEPIEDDPTVDHTVDEKNGGYLA